MTLDDFRNQLEDRYFMTLASHPWCAAKLIAVIVIGMEASNHMEYEVWHNGKAEITQNLASATRKYYEIIEGLS
jgi:hypothetical protein